MNGKPLRSEQVEGDVFQLTEASRHLTCSGWPCKHACHDQVHMPVIGTDAVSLFSSFFVLCARCRDRQLWGRGRCVLCVCRVCWLPFQIMKCSREQRAGGPYSLCCSFIFTPISLWFFHTLLSCVCVCVFVCMSGCCVYRCPPPPPVSILHGRSP